MYNINTSNDKTAMSLIPQRERAPAQRILLSIISNSTIFLLSVCGTSLDRMQLQERRRMASSRRHWAEMVPPTDGPLGE